MMRAYLFLLSLAVSASSALAQNGLTAQYYDTAAFGSLVTTRTDPSVNFNWGTAIPGGTAITNGDTFSVIWNGQVEPEFSQNYTFYLTADDGAQLWVNDQLVVSRTYFATPSEIRGQVSLKAGQRVNIRLEYVEQTGAAAVKLEWSSASRAREVVPATRLFPTRVAKAGGSLLKEHWSEIPGDSIASLSASPNYPLRPGGREFITTFESLAQNWSESYGTRVTGFIVPPTSGNYTFAVSGDQVTELHLSTDATPANKVLIASLTSATGFRVWEGQVSQQSAALPLVQGQRYYVELLHKESTGNDHWSVGWKKPNDNDFSVVPGSALLQPGLATSQPAQAALLDTMAQDHPRIFATAERFAKLRTTWQSATPSQPKTWAQNAINAANGILPQAPVTYAPDVRTTILNDSRKVVDRMYKLGLAWHLTGDNQYAERAWTELSAVAAFPNWNAANHFLDTAEMTHACAIGYDWFYHYWTQERRDTIRTAIINMGLNPGLTAYSNNVGWSRPTSNNWNMVCNGGLAIGALAVGMESEALTENVLNRAINSTRPVWARFTTDCGGWYEGPGYWGYTTEYGIRMFAALEWVLGSDFGISSTQGVSESGFSPILSTGPTNVIFNFADAGASGPTRAPVYQWLARRYGHPLYDWWNNQGNGGALDALWFNESAASLQASGTPPDMAFHGDAGNAFQPQEMVTMRGKWNDTRTTFIGSKGGHMGADHGNLDAGTFVLDALGKRWFHDLGGDNYALPAYFSSTSRADAVDRWDYYRMRPEGQNTLTINPSGNADMVLNAVAPLISFQSERGGNGSFATYDLTSVYTGMSRVWRGTRLLGNRNQMWVQDEIQSATGKTVWWFAHFTSPATTVVISPDGTSAMMTQGAERLWCKIASGGGTFQIMDAVPLPTSPNPAGQNANSGFKKLAIQLSNVTNTTLAVWFVPLSTGEVPPDTVPSVGTLQSWNLAASNDPPVAENGIATGSGDFIDVDLRAYVADDATPPEQMRFSVNGGINGSVVLLADGHTARFTANPGYTGVPSFSFTATDTSTDPRMLLAYDFDSPDATTPTLIPDVTNRNRDGTIDFAGAGSFEMVADSAPSLVSQGARSLDLLENEVNAARLARTVTTAELNWSSGDWSVSGWFKRRDVSNDDFIWHIGAGDGFGTTKEMYVFCPSGQQQVRIQHHNGTAFDIDMTKTGIAAGAWHHFAVTRSGAILSFYVNGELVGTDNSFALALDQVAPLVFGGHADAKFMPLRWFDGRIDDVAVFTEALPPAEISRLAAGMTVRHFGGLSATGSISLSAPPVTYQWTNSTTGSTLPWSNGSNWSASTLPVSGRGASVHFLTGQTLGGGELVSHRDLVGPFVLNNLTLAGTATAASTVNITGGGLSFLNNGAINPSVTLSATNSGLIYQILSPITLGTNTTFSGTGTAGFRFSGPISGDGGLTKSSSGTLVLGGDNSYTGDTIISSGTLQIGADGATGSLGGGNVINNATLRFERTGVLDVSNNISGSGGVTIDCPINAGTIVLSGANSFAGNVTVTSGTLRITNSEALGAGTKNITLTNGTAGSPQLRLDGSVAPIELPPTFSFSTSNANGAIVNEAGNNIVSGNFNLSSGGGDTRLVVAAGSLTFEGNMMLTATSRGLQLAGAGMGAITGNILNGTGDNILSVTKIDAGTWTLEGANTWTGNTSINGGTLIMNGSLAAGGTVTVASTARLGGRGTLAANAQVNGTLQPGDGVGAITFTGNLGFGSASRISCQLGGNPDTQPGVGSDQILAAGVTITTNATVDLVLNTPESAVDFSQGFWAQARSWPMLVATTRTGTFKLGTISGDSAGRPVTGYGSFSLLHKSTGVDLVWTPLPPVQQWRFTHFSTHANSGNASDLADSDRDGVANLLEYALGGNPLASQSGILPQAGILNERLGIVFTRWPSRADLTLTVQASSSPSGPWSAIASSVNGAAFSVLAAGAGVVETGTGDPRQVEVRDLYPIGDPAHPRRFMRLHVSR